MQSLKDIRPTLNHEEWNLHSKKVRNFNFRLNDSGRKWQFNIFSFLCSSTQENPIFRSNTPSRRKIRTQEKRTKPIYPVSHVPEKKKLHFNQISVSIADLIHGNMK